MDKRNVSLCDTVFYNTLGMPYNVPVAANTPGQRICITGDADKSRKALLLDKIMWLSSIYRT